MSRTRIQDQTDVQDGRAELFPALDEHASAMVIADRLTVPDGTLALLFDLDGVLIDSLRADYDIVQRLMRQLRSEHEVDRAFIRANFAYSLPDFWTRTLVTAGVPPDPAVVDQLSRQHEEERRRYPFPVHDGIPEILADARSRAIRMAVVSNNPVAEVRNLVQSVGLEGYFDVLVGNDKPGLRKKPFPDCYQEAAASLGSPTTHCAAIEDSLLGVEAASRSGCYTVGVSTGANDFDQLAASGYANCCYTTFALPRVVLGSESITSKSLVTPNEFVSHMIEHIAWRMGRSVEVVWTNDDWRSLGVSIGRAAARLPRIADSAAAVGMIDDGSCEIELARSEVPRMVLETSRHVERDWFIGLRCEQLADGAPLLDLLDGIATGAELSIRATVASVEDAHHAWEGLFRALGIGLERMFGERGEAPRQDVGARSAPEGNGLHDMQRLPTDQRQSSVSRGWSVEHIDIQGSRLRRETAESVVRLAVSIGSGNVDCKLVVGDSIRVDGLGDVLAWFAREAGLDLEVEFVATRLSSSHVVMEDVGLALGRALSYLLARRMDELGIYGAGCSVKVPSDLSQDRVRAAISVEGRKFWRFVPLAQDYEEFKRTFLVGHTLSNGLFTEDLDDFVDGLAGGLGASIVIHFAVRPQPSPDWPHVFAALGRATAGALAENPSRRGLIAGVKATLV
jgi:HAD superfamily hydrolase (TIGR01509 family)